MYLFEYTTVGNKTVKYLQNKIAKYLKTRDVNYG